MNNPLQNTLLGGSLYYVVLPHNRVKVLLKSHENLDASGKVQLFSEDHSLDLSSNCFDKLADLLSKCQNK